jgi:hypothetical protein
LTQQSLQVNNLLPDKNESPTTFIHYESQVRIPSHKQRPFRNAEKVENHAHARIKNQELKKGRMERVTIRLLPLLYAISA